MSDDCLCDHGLSEHEKVGERLECFSPVAEGWLCGCMNYEPAPVWAERTT